MRQKVSYYNSRYLFFMVMLIGVVFIAPEAIEAADVAKNNGVLINRDLPKSVPPNLDYGTRVQAVVNYPSGSDCILIGDTGTVYCYDAGDPQMPYLVNWDSNCGYEQCQVCGVCAPHGWWVGYDEISSLCPAARLLKTEIDLKKEAEKKLSVIRSYRNKVLSQNEPGREFIGLYYLHSTEINQIMTKNPGLSSKTASLLIKTLPAIEGAADTGKKLCLRTKTLSQINQILDEYKAQASPELAVAIEELRTFLKEQEQKN